MSRQMILSKETLKIAFRLLDHNEDGLISMSELKDAFKTKGVKIEGQKIWDDFFKKFEMIR